MKTEKKPDTQKSITIWEQPKSMLKSQYGLTTYLEWCNKEVLRMRANGRKAVVVENDGLVAVVRP